MKRIAVIAAIVIAGLGALALRVVLEGRAALADGDAAIAGQRAGDAIAAWESAARWYLPGAPHVDEAYARLLAVARTDRRHALTAWRAIRSAALATRSLWTPHADALAEANAGIAQASADDLEAALASGPDHATRLAWQHSRLVADPRPSAGAAVLAIAGIACWLGGIAWIVRRGIDDAGALIRRPALAGAAITVLGVVGWAAGLYNA